MAGAMSISTLSPPSPVYGPLFEAALTLAAGEGILLPLVPIAENLAALAAAPEETGTYSGLEKLGKLPEGVPLYLTTLNPLSFGADTVRRISPP